jgi:DNA-binding NarL/FixJ family response regulator
VTEPETGESATADGAAHDASGAARREDDGAHGRGEAERIESLTPREVEVLRLLSQGQTNPQIAQNLSVSRGTVKIHVQHIISKLGVSDRTQAAVRAIEFRLTTSGID